MYTDTEYKERIARPGDGDPNHVFSINFNKAQAKIAESVQVRNCFILLRQNAREKTLFVRKFSPRELTYRHKL